MDMVASNDKQVAPMMNLVVTFRVGYQRCALPLGAVLQVVRLPALVPIPGAPAEICGLLDLHGMLLPTLNSHVLIGETPAATLDSHVLIIGAANVPRFAMLVDQVEQVQPFDHANFGPLKGGADFLMGALRDQIGTLLVLDPMILEAHSNIL